MAKKILSVGSVNAYLNARNAVLESAGYQVLSTTSIAEARELAASEKPDLLLLAHTVSDEERLELLKELQGKLPVLLLVSESNPGAALPASIAQHALEGPERLLESVARLMERSSSQGA